MDAINMAHYQTDYTTKAGPVAGEFGVLSAQSSGLAFLRLQQKAEREAEEAEREAADGDVEAPGAPAPVRRTVWGEVLHSARRTVIKLSTSSHRALLKKLPEMMFQMQYGHECYMSHDTWTLYCKGIVALAFRASHAVQNKKDDFWNDPRAADIEVDQPAVGEVPDGEGGGGLMAAPVSYTHLTLPTIYSV